MGRPHTSPPDYDVGFDVGKCGLGCARGTSPSPPPCQGGAVRHFCANCSVPKTEKSAPKWNPYILQVTHFNREIATVMKIWKAFFERSHKYPAINHFSGVSCALFALFAGHGNAPTTANEGAIPVKIFSSTPLRIGCNSVFRGRMWEGDRPLVLPYSLRAQSVGALNAKEA